MTGRGQDERWWILVGVRGRGRFETGPYVRSGEDGRVGDSAPTKEAAGAGGCDWMGWGCARGVMTGRRAGHRRRPYAKQSRGRMRRRGR